MEIHYYYGKGIYRQRTGQSRVLESVQNVRDGNGVVCQNCVLEYRKSNLNRLNRQYLLLILIYSPLTIYVFQTNNSFILLQLLANVGIFVIPFLTVAIIWNVLSRNTLKDIHWIDLLANLQIGTVDRKTVLMTDDLFHLYTSEGKIDANEI